MNRFLIIAATLAISGTIVGQNLKVEQINATMDPMTVPMQRLDANEQICALVKVLYPKAGLVFEGNVVGDSPLRTNQYWVYLTAGTKFLQINAPEHYPLRIDFRDYGINGLEGKRIYEVKLSSDMTAQQQAQSAPTSNAQTTPPSATAYNPEISDNSLLSKSAEELFALGKDYYARYDKMLGNQAGGRAVDKKQMAQLLIDGYDSLIAALKKGSKKSKDINKILSTHYNDYYNACVNLWELKDFDMCDKVLTVYETMPFNSLLSAPPAAPDSKTFAYALYIKGLANWQKGDLKRAADAFDKSIQYDNTNKEVLKYGCAVHIQAGNPDRYFELARIGNENFGKEDEDFALYMANYYLERERKTEALDVLTKAEQYHPSSVNVKRSLGICLQHMSRLEDAKSHLQIAYRWNPDDALTNLSLGQVLYSMAQERDEKASGLTAKQYNENRRTNIDPLLREAIPYLERAYQSNDNREEARKLLRGVYYSLGDEANMRRYE